MRLCFLLGGGFRGSQLFGGLLAVFGCLQLGFSVLSFGLDALVFSLSGSLQKPEGGF